MIDIVIQSCAGVLWTLAYVLIIRRSRRDRVYGMPLVALCANITWEFWYSLVDRPPLPDASKRAGQFTVDFVWFVFDLVIVAQTLRYGPRQFAWLGRRGFYALFALMLAVTGPSVVLVNKEFHDVYAIRVTFLQTLLMSGLFLAMLNARRSLAGQSLGVALAKMGGTVLASLGVLLYPPDPVYRHSVLLPFLYVAIFALDLTYTLLVWHLGREERRTGAASPVEEPIPA